MNVVDVDYNSLFGVYLEVHKRKQQSIYIYIFLLGFRPRFISGSSATFVPGCAHCARGSAGHAS